jgi:hypothetical protein
MAAAAIPRAALTLTQSRHAAGRESARTQPGPARRPARMPAEPRGSGARGHIGDRHPALPMSGPGIVALQAGARVRSSGGKLIS